MREIKFRVWDKRSKEMSVQTVGPSDWGDYLIDFKDGANDVAAEYCEWLQYTGLKDKNGVEIYEGDIVRGPSNSAVILETSAKSNRQIEAIFEVWWSKNLMWGGWSLRAHSKTHRTYPPFHLCEVIGNIYENPELLNKQGE